MRSSELHRRAARLFAAAVLALVPAACADDPTGPSAQPGVLQVSLAVPDAGASALVLRIAGPDSIGSVVPAGSYAAYAQQPGTNVKVAVFGALAGGPLLRFEVADVHLVGSYSVTILEVAGTDNTLRGTSGFSATVVRE